MMHPKPIAGAVLLCAVFGVVNTTADIVEMGSMKDNTLYESSTGAFSNGAGQHFFSGKTGQGRIRRGLIGFDIAGSIPAGSIINSVSLTLHMSQTQAGDQDVALHSVLGDWGEGSSNAGGGEGSGAASQAGDATWIHTFFDTDSWTNPGGDFANTSSAFQTIGAVGFYTWDTNATMVSDVQGWLDNPSDSFGWLLLGNESTSQTAKRFDTKENPTAEFRPVLIIDYTPVPAPGAMGMLLMAGLGYRRRRR